MTATPTSPNLPEPATCEDCLTVVAERVFATVIDHHNSTYSWQGNVEGAYERAIAQHKADGIAKVLAILSDAQLLAAEVERLRDLADSEGSRAVAYLRRARKAEADAERYQLLRRGQKWSVIDGIGDTLRAEQLDAAIDASRLALKEAP